MSEEHQVSTRLFHEERACVRIRIVVEAPETEGGEPRIHVTSQPEIEGLEDTHDWLSFFLDEAQVDPHKPGMIELEAEGTRSVQVREFSGYDSGELKRLRMHVTAMILFVKRALIDAAKLLPDLETIDRVAAKIVRAGMGVCIKGDNPCIPRRGFITVLPAQTKEDLDSESGEGEEGQEKKGREVPVVSLFTFGEQGKLRLREDGNGWMTLWVSGLDIDNPFARYFNTYVSAAMSNAIHENERDSADFYRGQLNKEAKKILSRAYKLERAFELPEYEEEKMTSEVSVEQR